MSSIILITGQVKFTINLDPSIWIIDDRRFPLEERLNGVEGLALELAPFLSNAEPDSTATHVICHRSVGDPVKFTFEQVKSSYLCFAKDGKPIRDGGPALLYLADGSNKEAPVDFITKLEVV
ncbi:hypothetical protein [Hazenella coriacea]|uniref:Uncharacterized protein n=1 Tax=Hazenella coriacea TaxID=1179467 RepID=A0A4V2UVG1_9BACL|nr:hypothetical protein [Hazenella coriacea]TCS95037.1 hypothetical protein EDD58_103462 [Hazenella coriacea]